jgi:ketosteroid isomerase-like protein
MSQEHVGVVRGFLGPWEGVDLVPLRRDLSEVDPAAPDAVAAYSKLNPGGRYLDPGIEWDLSATGGLAGIHRGFEGFVRYWIDWLEMWSSYAYHVVEYRDLGEWVLTPMQVEGQGRDGMAVGLRVFQLWLVRDGRIVVMRAFHDEADSLKAAGLPE